MSRELKIQIDVETQNAEAKVKRVDAAIDGVTDSARKADAATSKLAATTQALGGKAAAAGGAGGIGALNASVAKMVVGFAAGFASVQALRNGIGEVVAFVGDSVKAFAEQEAAVRKMTTALQAQGQATPKTVAGYKALASEFQRTTVYGDELVNEMQALLIQVGNVMPSQMKRALQASTDLASGLGIDLRAATLLVGKAFAGETSTLKRYGVVVDEMRLKTEGASAVLDTIHSKFGGQAQSEAASYAGQIRQIANAWGDLKEAVGGVSVMNPFVQLSIRFVRDQLVNGAPGEPTDYRNVLSNALRYVPGQAQTVPFLRAAENYADLFLSNTPGVPGAPGMFGAQTGLPTTPASAVKALEELDAIRRNTGITAAVVSKNTLLSTSPLRVSQLGGLPSAEGMRPGDYGNLMPLPSTSLGGYMSLPAGVTGNLSGGGGGWVNSAFAQLPGAILGAIQGGGSVGGTIGGLFGGGLFGKQSGLNQAITGGLSKLFGTTGIGGSIGGALGSILPGAGTLLGGLLGGGVSKLFGGLFGKSEGWKQDRAADQQLDATRSQLLQTYGSLDEIKRLGAEIGVDLAGAWGDRSAAGLEHFNGLLDQFREKLQLTDQIKGIKEQIATLEGELVPTWDQVNAAVQRYGGNVDGLGRKLQQLYTTDTATQMINDWELLTRAGGSATTVAKMMQEEVNALVQQSIKYGTAIPENMRPVLESLADQGLLLDASGKKITDLGGLKFGPPVKSQADIIKDAISKLDETLQKFIERLSGLDGKQVNVGVNTNYSSTGLPPWAPENGGTGEPPPGVPPGSTNPDYWHLGGYVASRRIGMGRVIPFPNIAPRLHLGADEVPAILQTGEGVLSRRGMQAVGGPSRVHALNQGRGGSGGPSIVIGPGAVVINNPVLRDRRQADELTRAVSKGLMREAGRRWRVA
jgi:hypothetical protein